MAEDKPLVEPIEQPDWVEPVRKAIGDHIGQENLDSFCALLKFHGALLAGGFVLKAVRGEKDKGNLTDLDIYVPSSYINMCLYELLVEDSHPLTVKSRGSYTVRSSLYCNSFLKRNGIKSVNTIQLNTLTKPNSYIYADFMAVRNKRSPLEVVTNFDLTMCQVWFDGKSVFATHPDHIKQGMGVLQGDYVTTFLEGNAFLKNRIEKYMKRGYQISLDPRAPMILSQKDKSDVGKACKKKDILPIDEKYMHSIRRAIIKMINEPHEIITLPFDNESYYINNEMIINYDNNYDSEDEDSFMEKIPDIDRYRATTKLYINTFAKLTCLPDRELFSNNRSRLADIRKEGQTLYDSFHALLLSILPSGENMTMEEGSLFYLHEHPIVMEGVPGGITEDGLRGYLSSLDPATRIDAIPCFFAPYCKKHISEVEIAGIFHTEDECTTIIKKFKKAKVKGGLDEIIPYYDTILYDRKKYDPQYGYVYTTGTCPFCLEFVARESDCAYMTHANPERKTRQHAPFCPNNFDNLQIRNQYMDAAIANLKREYQGANNQVIREMVVLSFCIECGRPCFNHQHFDFSYPPKPVVVQNNDYGRCTGGRRRELIARMLAVRDFYILNAHMGFDPIKLRHDAAQKAESAAKNEEYLKRADVILGEGKELEDELDRLREQQKGKLPESDEYRQLSQQISETDAKLTTALDLRKWDNTLPSINEEKKNEFDEKNNQQGGRINAMQRLQFYGGQRRRQQWKSIIMKEVVRRKKGGAAPQLNLSQFIGNSACKVNRQETNHLQNTRKKVGGKLNWNRLNRKKTIRGRDKK